MLAAVHPTPATSLALAPAFGVGRGAVSLGRTEDNQVSAIALNSAAPQPLPEKLVNMVGAGAGASGCWRWPGYWRTLASAGCWQRRAGVRRRRRPTAACALQRPTLPCSKGVAPPRAPGGGGGPPGAGGLGSRERHVCQRRARGEGQPPVSEGRRGCCQRSGSGTSGMEGARWRVRPTCGACPLPPQSSHRCRVLQENDFVSLGG